MTLNCWKFKFGESKRWRACAMALLSFIAGSFITACLAHIYHVAGGQQPSLRASHLSYCSGQRVPALELRFRDTASKLLLKHHLKVVGYWIPEGSPDWDNTFIYLVAHSSREDAKKNWDAMMADQGLQEMIKSEKTNKLVEKIDVTYMRPTDFSSMK